MIKLNDDIYDLTNTVNEVQQNFIDEENSETLAAGTYGYMAGVQALQLQNSTIVATEMGNELFPSKAKFERNVISHAIIQNIVDINATPSKMQILLGIEEVELNKLFINDTCTIDRDCSIYVETFEFHLEYNLIISKSYITNNEFIYTARYDISRDNPLSDITNPYLTTPFIQVFNTKRYLYIPCRIMQVEHDTIYKKMITSNSIDNKTFEFEFENQLASFEVCIKEGGETTYLTPLFEGVGIDNNITNYCFYIYLDASHIRVKFDSLSYMPGVNAEIEVYIRTTQGEKGNFDYDKKFITSINSDVYNYKNLSINIYPVTGAVGGIDRKSVDELRRLLPKEALSRGGITNIRDLQNFFNMINGVTNIMLPQKKVDNQFERSYYAYLLLKDNYGNVIPTNTIDLQVAIDEFHSKDNRKYVLKQGCCIYYDGTLGKIYKPDDPMIVEMLKDDRKNFIYTIPFTLVITADPLYASYYMTIMNDAGYLEFTYINQNSVLQFISTSVGWKRSYTEDPNIYKMTMNLTQNITTDQGLVEIDENGNIIRNDTKVIAVLYNTDESEVPYRYAHGTLDKYDPGNQYLYTYSFGFETDDKINDDNRIRINNLFIPGTDDKSYGYFSGNIHIRLYVLIKLEGKEFGRYDLDTIVPGLEGYTVCNMYTVQNGLYFYTNYSQIVNSTVKDISIKHEYEYVQGFSIKSVPVVRYNYSNVEESMIYLINALYQKKAYLDNVLTLLENNFMIDFKLFNTYGPSKIYSIDKTGSTIVDRVNLTLNFELKLLKTADTYTREYIISDVKDIIENLNNLASLHIPNIITTITTKYQNSIEYFEFLGFNDYGPGVQHLYRNEYDEVSVVPEFLTIHTLEEGMEPDIDIRLA